MKKIIPVLFASLLLSCNQQPNQHPAQDHEEHGPAKEQAVELNNGEKWQANPETTEGIHNMMAHIEDFEKSDEKDYAALKNDLEKEFGFIVKECTMKGESHNQLHNYIYPLKEDIDQLSEKNLDSVKRRLNKYERYFE